VFRRFFDEVVERCRAAGLVWGRELYVDATKVEADASLDSRKPRFFVEAHLERLFSADAPAAPAALPADPGGQPKVGDAPAPHRRPPLPVGRAPGAGPGALAGGPPVAVLSRPSRWRGAGRAAPLPAWGLRRRSRPRAGAPPPPGGRRPGRAGDVAEAAQGDDRYVGVAGGAPRL
jgi:hypothetical protein